MSVQLAKNEKLIREFEYANGGAKVSKKLRVTTQRIIHEETAGKYLAIHREMPLEDAKYVDAALGKISKVALLVWGWILMLIGAGLGAFAYLEDLGVDLFGITDLNMVLLITGGLIAFIGFILFLSFFGSRHTLLKCVISTDHAVSPVISISEMPVVKSTKATREITLDLQVNRKAAKALVEELGAAIIEAKEYEEPVVEEAPAVVEEVVAEDAPVAEVAPVEVAPVEEAPVEEIVEEPAEGVATAEEAVMAEAVAEEVAEATEAVVEEATEETAEAVAEETSEEVTEEAAVEEPAIEEEVVHETIEIEVEAENVADALKEAMQIAENAEDAEVKIEVVLDLEKKDEEVAEAAESEETKTEEA